MNRFRVNRTDGDTENPTADINSGVILKAYSLENNVQNTSKLPEMNSNGKALPSPPCNVGRKTSRKFSFAHMTREALPRLDNYRRSLRALKRPSLGQLHGETIEIIQDTDDNNVEPNSTHTGIKLGWIQGVLIPCLLNIWGVMLFLRLAWVVAQSGIGQTILIISVSSIVCVITTLSLSAISTNGEVKGGGIYYIISRSLGPEFGASIGVVFAFANAVAASMNTIGFCSSVNDLLKSFNVEITGNPINDIRIVGTVALAVMIIICAIGMEWESKAQNLLVAIIVAAIFNFIIGACIGPTSEQASAEGFTGLNSEIFMSNWAPDYRYSEGVQQSFFSVFAIFFPSVTGIQAGANISGDLKDPASSIPKGTLLAVLISTISYLAFVLFAGASAVRDASGNITELINGSLVGVIPDCLENHSCEYGLHNSYTIMQLMAASSALIYAGCWAATLSTALTNLLSVPRLIQALGIDRIYPGLIFFSKGYGKHGEPYRGYVLTFIISALFLLIAELNAIAPLISTFYLASYALINFCTFHAAFVKPLGWRPTFKYYNAWLSLFGFVICVSIMFLIDWKSSLITFAIIFALYLVVVYRKPDVNWGSTTQAQTYKTVLSASHRLMEIGDHVKNYTPQVLVLAGSPSMRPPLVDLANLITKNNSLLIVGEVIPTHVSYKIRKSRVLEGQQWLTGRKIRAFYNVVSGLSMENGVDALIQASGYGKMTPNIVMMGYKSDWSTCSTDELISYFNILHNAFSNRMAVAILRLPKGLDFSYINIEMNPNINIPLTTNSSTSTLVQSNSIGEFTLRRTSVSQIMHVDSNLNLAGLNTNATTPGQTPPPGKKKNMSRQILERDRMSYTTHSGGGVPKELMDAMNTFHIKKPKGTIDVWWLYDDGGLTILLPYILSTRSIWSNCKIRVFALTNHQKELEIEEKNMAILLAKLRIQYSSLTMVQGMDDHPAQRTIDLHNEILDGFNQGQNEDCFVPAAELSMLEEKTHRQLRLRELLIEHSTTASLIFMSLPMPRQGAISAPLYMSWLEILTKDMPPFILVRGNQSSVLTFYS